MRPSMFGILVVAISLGGCASVVRGTTEPVAFDSSPPGAAVTMSNGLQCPATPCTVSVPRRDEFSATFSKPGFEPQSVQVSTRLSGGGVAAGAGNILVGGAIGVGVDAINGANLDHVPNPVDVTLQPSRPAAPGSPRSRFNRAPVS